MRDRIEGDFLLKVFSVLFAILLWLFVINTDNPIITKTIRNVPVDILNEQVLDQLNRTYKIKDGSTVSFTIKGKRTLLDKLKRSDFRATADVSAMSKVNAIPIKIIVPQRLRGQIEITSGDNQTVKVVLEDLKRSQIPVTVETKGKPANGYVVGSKTAKPNLLSVSGPKSVIRQIDNIRVTVDVSGLSESVNLTQKVTCFDYDGEAMDMSQFTLDKTKVKVQIDLLQTKTIPVNVKTIGRPADGYLLGTTDYEPKKVKVTGDQNDLQRAEAIELTTIDVSDSTKSVEKTIKAEDVQLPDGLSFVDDVKEMNDFVVKANVEKATSKTIKLPTSKIQLVNNNNNYKVKFAKKSIKIRVTGLQSVIDKMTFKDLNPKIDMTDYQTGTHTVQLQLSKVKNVSYDSNVSVRMTVSE